MMEQKMNIDQDKTKNEISDNSNEVGYHWYAVSVRVKSQETRLVRFFCDIMTHTPEIREVYLPKVLSCTFNEKKNKKIQKSKSAINYFFVNAAEGFLSKRELQIESNVPYQIIGEVSENEIKKMKEYFSEENQVSEENIEIKPNMIVKIREGAFAELNARVMNVYEVGGIMYADVMIWIIKGFEPLEHKIKVANLRPVYDGERINDE